MGALDISTRAAKMVLAAGWTAPQGVHGFVKGKSTVSAAEPHVGAPLVLGVDLKDFFGQVGFERVSRSLQERFATEVLDWVEGCCFVSDSLPLGIRTSPILSNIAFEETDHAVRELARTREVVYSRWVDDLSFSGVGVDDGFYADLLGLLGESGWRVNEDKTRFMRKSPYVLGLYVGQDVERPHLPRWMKQKLAVETYYYARYGAAHFEREDVWPRGRLYGMVAYCWVVDPDLAKSLDARLAKGERKSRSRSHSG